MAVKRILIVDDHKEAARLIRSNLETLEYDLAIEDVLSGEEAMLELGRGKIDLLIADFRLPGISGIELMDKYKAKNPDARIILISGVTDPKIRQQVAQAGADAFFFKPIDIPEFLDAVERSLGLVDTILQPELHLHAQEIKEIQQQDTTRVAEIIAELRTALDAIAVLLVGEDGKVVFRAGSLPDPELETSLMPSLMTTFNAGVKISHFLGQNRPDHFYSFRGENYDLLSTPTGDSHCLLMVSRPIMHNEIGDLAVKLDTASKNILLALARMGVSSDLSDEKIPPPQPAVEIAPASQAEPKTTPREDLPADSRLEDLFAVAQEINEQDADDFWETISVQEIKPELNSGDSLSYDQAARLGLAPKDD